MKYRSKPQRKRIAFCILLLGLALLGSIYILPIKPDWLKSCLFLLVMPIVLCSAMYLQSFYRRTHSRNVNNEEWE
jgi:uncharacterized membrane protein SirB2